MRAFFRYLRSKLDLVIWISPGLLAVAAFFMLSKNSTVMMLAICATIVLAKIWVNATLCKAASQGLIVLFLATISMPFLSTMAIAQGLQFSLDLQQKTTALAETESLYRTLLTLMLIITGYALIPAAFCLPASKSPQSRSKQDVLRRGAMIVLVVSSAALIALPIFNIVRWIVIGQ